MTDQTTNELSPAAELAVANRPLSAEWQPKTLIEAAKAAKVLDNQRTRPLPQARDYIHITVYKEFSSERFNGVENLVTESVEIAGVKLIWDTLDHDSPLRAYHKKLDMLNLTIYADQVIFRSEFLFHKTNVTIYARELLFEGDGCINTTPRAQTQKPFTPRDAGGYPPNYKTADGCAGEPGGAVALYVERFRIEGDDTAKKRIVCNGSRGQDGEDGGLKRYTPGKGGVRQPDASAGKNLDAVSLEMLKKKLQDLHHVPDNFHYPSYAEGNVVSATVIAYVPVAPLPILDQFFYPGPNELYPAKFKSFGVIDTSFWWSEKHGIRPGDGEDAYPSGTPGRGGNGGAVTVEYAEAQADIAALCENAGGLPGVSKGVNGAAPGTPSPAYHAHVFIVRSDADGEGLYHAKPYVKYQDVSNGNRGKDQPAPTAEGGKEGKRLFTKGGKQGWLHPLVVAGVIRYARDAYRNGYREDAKNILEPYREALSRAENLAIEIKPKQTAIVALLNNLNNNLDYYGNNIGWVPRLNVTTNFKLFERERVNASRLLYFAQTLAQKWDALKHTSDAANQAADALGAELDYAQAAIIDANDEFEAAKRTLDEIDKELQAAQRQFQRVYDRAWGIAQGHVKGENLVKGMCKLAGGLAKVVPIGQPYVGLAGDVVAEIGDFEWTDADGKFTWEQVASNFEGFGKDIGDKVDSFRKTHKDLLIKDQLKAGKDSLSRKIKDAKGAIKNLDDDIDAINRDIEAEWDRLRNDEVQAIKNRIEEIERQLKNAQPAPNEKSKLEKQLLTFEEELQQAYNERLQAAKVRLENELANKTAELEAKDIKHKEQLKAQVKKLLEKKAAEQQSIEDLNKKEKERETKVKETFDAMAGVGDGIASIGAGVTAMFAKIDKDNPKLKALLENIETSELFDAELKRDFREFRATLEQINEKKSSAVSALLGVQQRIAQYSETIANNLAELVSLGKQRQSLDGVLGVETRQYLHDMQQRSKERLYAYLYEFVKSYQYQYLKDVSDTFYNFDKWVDKLRQLESLNADGTVNTVPLDKFQEIEQTVTRSEYLEMARQIVAERQKQAGSSQNSYICILSDEQRAFLARNGYLNFNVFDDFKTNAHLAMRDARIMDIDLKQFKLELAPGASGVNLHVDFEHSGTSILRDSHGQYWFFQKGQTDDSIRWRYIWKGKDRLDKDVKIDDDEFLDKLLPEGQIKYREYMPALFSNITLWINKNTDADRRMQDVAKITAVEFELKFLYS